jgi:hypothetical protein
VFNFKTFGINQIRHGNRISRIRLRGASGSPGLKGFNFQLRIGSGVPGVKLILRTIAYGRGGAYV